jgi:hypothetical protein
MLIAVALDAVTPEGDALLRGADAWRDSLVLGITLVIVGVPLWARYWFQTQQEATERGEVERSSLPRRIFLFAIFGLAALIAIVDLTVILYTLFEGMLEGTLSSEVIRDTRWSVALVLVAGAVGVHYWLVMREDQAASAAEVPEASGAVPVTVRRRSVTVLAPDGAEDLREVIAAIPGVSLRAWRRLDAVSPAPVIDAARLDDLRVAIAEADADQILVLVRDGTFEVIPYRD